MELLLRFIRTELLNTKGILEKQLQTITGDNYYFVLDRYNKITYAIETIDNLLFCDRLFKQK